MSFGVEVEGQGHTIVSGQTCDSTRQGHVNVSLNRYVCLQRGVSNDNVPFK